MNDCEDDLLDVVSAWIDEHRLTPSGSRGLVALSGGPDSLALLHLLSRLKQPRGLILRALIVDHGLRQESSNEACWARDEAARFGVEAGIVRLEGLGAGGGNVQERARRARLAALEAHAGDHGCHWVALGHSADDQAETVLMRLLRGAGTQGLAGMRPRRGVFVRPLLSTTRQRIEAYLRRNGLCALRDPSNESDRYLRTRIRQRLMPTLKADNPRLVEALCRAADSCWEDHQALQAHAQAIVGSCLDGDTLRLAPLAELEGAVLNRVLRLAYASHAGSTRRLSRQHVLALAALARSADGTKALDLPRVRVERRYDRLVFGPPARVRSAGGSSPVRLTVAGCGRYELGDGRVVELEQRMAAVGDIDAISLRSAVFPLTIATPSAGSRLQIGPEQHKRVSRLLQEARVPATRRHTALVLISEDRCQLLVGIRRAFEARPDPGSAAICLTITGEAKA